MALGMAALLALAQVATAAPTPAQKCAAKLRLCCGKGFAAAVTCHAKAAMKGSATGDPACVQKARGKLAACAKKPLAKGGCLTDQAGMDHLTEEIFDEWAADVAADLPIL